MWGPILSFERIALFSLLLISICCEFGRGASIEDRTIELSHEAEPNNYHDLAIRGDGTEAGAFTAVVGCTGVAPRLPIMTLRNNNPDVFNMFILALERIQNWPEDRVLSYFQLAGIHGFPFTPWQYPPSATVNPGLGYCTHNSGLFLTWHRPYLVLLEQLLWREARVIANQFTGERRTRYVRAANRVRLPYWDWAAPADRSRIPSVLKEQRITVVKPVGSRTIANPLYSYRFLRGSPGAGFGPTTVRGPNDNDLADSFPGRIQGTLDLFARTTFTDATRRLEGIHNNIHVLIGGDMPIVTRSAFDPIFWLHHANVDRLTAMYQATHPGVRMTPRPRSPTFALGGSGPDDLSTPLYPFRHPNGQEWRSSDISAARSIHSYGYSYPEVPANLAQPELSTFTTRRINELYRPNLASSSFNPLTKRAGEVFTRREWSCNVQYDMKELSGPSYRIMFYLDAEDTKTFVGVASIFAGTITPIEMPNSVITMDVPLTSELVEPTANLTASAVVPLLTDQLYWEVERVNSDGSITGVPVEEIPSLKIATYSTLAEYPADLSQLPQKGDETIYLDPTKDKNGGLEPADDTSSFVEEIGDGIPEVIENIGDAIPEVIDAVLP